MKSTESLDDAGKLTVLSSTTGETGMPGDTSITENKRRRLVRGAVVFAPLVLTLRSGALAAASCTGTRVLSIDTNDQGVFTSSGNGVVEGDFCVDRDTAQACGSEHPTKIQTVGAIKDDDSIIKLTDNTFQCGVKKSRTVAILSSGSASSLNG